MERMEMSYVNVPLRPKPVRGSHSAERKWYLIHLFSFGLLCLIQVILNIALRLTYKCECECNTTVLESRTSPPARNETQQGPLETNICCSHFYQNRLPKSKVKGYSLTSPFCAVKAIILTIQNGVEICVSPDKKWVKDITHWINQEKSMLNLTVVTPSPEEQ